MINEEEQRIPFSHGYEVSCFLFPGFFILRWTSISTDMRFYSSSSRSFVSVLILRVQEAGLWLGSLHSACHEKLYCLVMGGREKSAKGRSEKSNFAPYLFILFTGLSIRNLPSHQSWLPAKVAHKTEPGKFISTCLVAGFNSPSCPEHTVNL